MQKLHKCVFHFSHDEDEQLEEGDVITGNENNDDNSEDLLSNVDDV